MKQIAVVVTAAGVLLAIDAMLQYPEVTWWQRLIHDITAMFFGWAIVEVKRRG
jgi:uncharacterized membrane protein YadS